MSAVITLTLPDTVLERAQLWAEHSGQPVTDFFTSTIELSLLPLGQSPPPVADWEDGDVLSASKTQLPFEDDQLGFRRSLYALVPTLRRQQERDEDAEQMITTDEGWRPEPRTKHN